jgi:hypothetical protein
MAKNIFNSIQLKKPKNNFFDLTHDVKLSANMGELTPILALECVPGDKFDLGCESIIRFAPMVAPVMHRMDVTMHYFFVPNRILWDNWERFITNSIPGVEVVPPTYVIGEGWYTDPDIVGAGVGRFLDYMGIPPIPAGGQDTYINALPLHAYLAIWNEYYRDQNLVDEINYKLTDGVNNISEANIIQKLGMKLRAWEHDYFTSSLPFAQKGAAVDIPLGQIAENAPIYRDTTSGPTPTTLSGTPYSVVVAGSNSPTTSTDLFAATGGMDIEPTTINDLRRAYRLQEWLEKNARGGTRYIESILSHFGVKSSDARLQRPEYITGVKTPVVISEVLNTSGTQDQLPQGNMAGHGIAVSSGRSGSYYCEEHGYIIGIMSVMPKTAYQQGIPRTYSKLDPLDYFWPSFANIGEQEVKVKELYAYTNNADDTFGYVPRYAEYKYMPSRVAGDFRTSLDYWHLGRIFESEPALNADFVQCSPEATQRIFAVEDPDAQKLYCHVLNKIKAVRPMPKYGTPTI